MIQTTYRLAIIGFGSAGQGLARILRDRGPWLREARGADIQIVGVATRSRGAVHNPAGMDPALLLTIIERDGHLRNHPAAVSWDADELIAQSGADVLVEVSPTNFATGEPATGYIRAAIARGMHIVTANKGPVALHFAELTEAAAAAGLSFGFEGTVMSGTPSLRLCWSDLVGGEVRELHGIVNGTTNYILTEMERGRDYADVLAEAQRLGYAEADPSGDVDGHDAAGKAVILANVLMGATLTPDDVDRAGITGLSREMVVSAAGAGERWKLIARIWRDGDGVHASVQPTRLPATHPLASVSGATNALSISVEPLGEVTIIGPGAGSVPTGFALLSDILKIAKHL
jgi:homoserine dehydrogenase